LKYGKVIELHSREKNIITMRNLLTLLFAFICVIGFAQEYEVGLKGGVNLFHGDLVPDIVDLDAIGYGGGLFARYHFNPKFNIRVSANYGQYTGSDLNTPERAARGYSFESTLIDFTVGTEWNLLGVNIYQNQKRFSSTFTPYLFLGVGANMADVTVATTLEGNSLDPIDALKEYPSISMVVPMAFGIRYSLNKIVIGIEGTLTAGLNDYLDGFSKSANPQNNDWYTSIGITVAYRIGESASSYMSDDEPNEYLEEEDIYGEDEYEEEENDEYEDDNY